MRENTLIHSFLALLLVSASAAQENQLVSLEQAALRNAAQAAAPFVVQIETLGGLERVEGVLVGTGPTSGLIVADDGYIVSSAFNFIQQPTSILVTLPDGQRRPATIVARDQSRMLVLLKVECETPLPVPAAVPRSEMRVGQWAVAVGRALSSDEINLSVGILSAVDRIWGKAIQTDAKISPSNYGGPLVDLQGRVLGILVPLSPDAQTEVAGAEWYDSGIGFAIPLVDLLARLDILRSGRDLAPGILGISLKSSDVYSDSTEIGVVQAKSPASEAGLKAGDRIVEINGHSVRRGVQMKHALGPLYAGDRIDLVVLRDEQRVEASAVLTDKLIPYERPFLGILPQPTGDAGVRVRFVYPESSAEEAGLEPLDQIQFLEGDPVVDVEQLRIQLADRQPGDVVELKVRRDGAEIACSVALSGLPTDLPPEFPAPEAPAASDAAPAETGTIEVRIPEQPNACSAYVPESYTGDRLYGLLVSLDPPGSKDATILIDQWKEACAEHDLILLAPQSQDPTRWLPTEVDFVRKTIEQVLAKYRIDPSRVVVHGREGGAAMAYLVTFSQRDVVRGVIAEDAPLPMGLRAPMPEPLQPLAILAIQARESTLRSRIDAGLERLRAEKFPVSVMDLGDQPRSLSAIERSLVGRWIEGLSRL